MVQFGARATASGLAGRDRKSTRLNSSHTVISYAVFCLKKKKPGEPDRDVGEPLAPRAPEGVGEDHEDVAPGQSAEPVAKSTRPPVGILGHKRDAIHVHV